MFTDQPGRWLAVLVFAPLLLQRGILHDDVFIIAFACMLFVWDLTWLIVAKPKRPFWDRMHEE